MKDEWKAIPGYNGKYEASFFGQIRRIYQKAPPKILSQYERRTQKGSPRLYVKLTKDGEEGKDVNVAQIIYTTFRGSIPQGTVIVHKNGLTKDNILTNLVPATKKEIGLKHGARSKRKPVVQIDAAGEVTNFYYSAREAARENFMSYQTIIDRCNGKVKKGPAPDGFEYAWEDEECSLRWACQRLRIQKIKL